MALQQTVTVTEELTLTPKVAKKLTLELQVYQKARQEMKAAERRMEASKVKLGALRDELGVESLEHDGCKVTLVAGTHTKFNEKRFIALGGELAIYQQALETKPSKPYELVSVPKVESDD